MGPQLIERSRLREREQRQAKVQKARAEKARSAPADLPANKKERTALRLERAARMPEVREQRLAEKKARPQSTGSRIAVLEQQVADLTAQLAAATEKRGPGRPPNQPRT